jgi:hypothetical protein
MYRFHISNKFVSPLAPTEPASALLASIALLTALLIVDVLLISPNTFGPANTGVTN